MANSFTRKTSWFWQNAENLLIILFLATFSLNIRKVFLAPYSFLNGEFNEYMTPSFSWADLLMLAVIIIYTIKWLYSQFLNPDSDKLSYNNKYNAKSSVLRCITNVSCLPRTIITRLCQVVKSAPEKAVMVRGETTILLLFLLWTVLSILWSNYQPIAIYRFATFLEILLFAVIALKSLKSQKWLNLAFFALITNGLFQSILGIAQFIRNKSLGIHWLGESILGPNLPGVAKVIVNSEKHIRAYGTLPHPNILAGFLIIPIFIILAELLARLTVVEKSNEPRTTTPQHYRQNCIFVENFKYIFHKLSNWFVEVRGKEVSRGTFLDITPTWLLVNLLIIISFSFLLTFSRSAFLGLTTGLLILCLWRRKTIFKQFHFVITFLILLILLISGYFAYHNKDLVSIFSTQSLEERNFYQNVARETISTHSMAGIGIGQFILNEFQKYPNLEGWQYQPVHNVYLLVFSELGIFGLVLFLLLLAKILERGTGEKTVSDLELTGLANYCIVFSFLFIFLFDHYFWDIKLGMIIFILPILLPKTTSCEKA